MSEQKESSFSLLVKLKNIAETRWFNAIWFQSTWFCAVLGRNELLGLTASLLLLHFLLTKDWLEEVRHACVIGGAGIFVDAILSFFGIFCFDKDVLLPLWMCGLWIAFSTTLTRSLFFLSSRPMTAIFLGAIVVPLNYGVGERVGAVEFGLDIPQTLLILALIWAVLLPVLYSISNYISQNSFK